MELNAEAVSGQSQTDNAGRAGNPLTDAIERASNASNGKSSAEAKSAPSKATPTDERAQSSPDGTPDAQTDAGDNRPSEQASKSKTKSSVPDDKAVGNDQAKAVEAPNHWAKEDKDAFEKVPREGQDILLKLARNLQAGFTRKSQETSDTVKFASTVRELFDEGTKAQMERAGVDEVGTVRYLLDLQRAATHDPVSYVRWFMQQTGMTPDHLGLTTTSADQKSVAPEAKSVEDANLRDLLADPEVKQLKTELAQLKGYVENIQARDHSAQQQQQYAAQQRYSQGVQSIQSTIRDFRSALDDTGNVAHPHFDAVQAHMGALMEHDQDLKRLPDGPEKLAAAYDMAIWARPDLRKTLVEGDRSRTLAEARKKDEAERAKRVTGIKPSSGAPLSKSKPKNLDDIIRESMGKFGV